ncbi:MAG: glycosyltransferase family 4 protein [Syntrophaceae bacterium]|nr:glycosyltransferase family 4 protein [Syntrophaceae bacterium]
MAKLTVFFLFPLWSLWVGWRNRIDLLVAFGSVYAFIMSFTKWLLQKPMVTFIRGDYSFALRMQNFPKTLLLLNKVIEYYGLLFSDKIITNNSTTRDEILKSLGKGRIPDVLVLYNNINPINILHPEDISETKEKYGIPENAKVLVTAGILTPGKNIELLINCLPQIRIENLYLFIVGDSPMETNLHYRNSLQGLARKLGVEEKVIFTGWIEKEELWKIYLASDLFVLPSLNEGMPNAMLEALGSNLPCLGSNIPGMKDILQYDELQFFPLDGKTLVDKIDHFFSNIEVLDRIKKLCQERKKVFTFDWKEEVFNTIKVFAFQKLLKKGL